MPQGIFSLTSGGRGRSRWYVQQILVHTRSSWCEVHTRSTPTVHTIVPKCWSIRPLHTHSLRWPSSVTQEWPRPWSLDYAFFTDILGHENHFWGHRWIAAYILVENTPSNTTCLFVLNLPINTVDILSFLLMRHERKFNLMILSGSWLSCYSLGISCPSSQSLIRCW